jgi:hypothetical protein
MKLPPRCPECSCPTAWSVGQDWAKYECGSQYRNAHLFQSPQCRQNVKALEQHYAEDATNADWREPPNGL